MYPKERIPEGNAAIVSGMGLTIALLTVQESGPRPTGALVVY